MKISDKQYLTWQGKLKTNKWFYRFWVGCGIYAILFFAAFATYFLFFGQGIKVVFLAVLAVLFTHFLACKLVHALHNKAHPYQRLGFKPPWSYLFSLLDQKHDSFPSEHISDTTAVSIIFFLFSPALGLLAFAVVIMIAVTRIILGYHDIYDVLGGLVLGFICGYGSYVFAFHVLFTR